MLPRMTTGNWLFWAVMAWIGINLIWLRFAERFMPQWVGAIIATGIAMALLTLLGLGFWCVYFTGLRVNHNLP